MSFIVILVVLFVVVLFVTAPLRRARRAEPESSAQLAELEAAREAKYREIRDAELDHRTGKLSDEDYEAVDGALRAEAIELMRRIDHVGAGAGEAPAVASGVSSRGSSGGSSEVSSGNPAP
jgi:hypothetical protein